MKTMDALHKYRYQKKTFTVHFPQIFFFVLFQEMVSERQSPTEEGVSVKKGGDGITQSIPS